MTREEAMTLLTRLHLIHTGMTGAGTELLIQIMQAGAAHEREACAKLLDDNWYKTQTEAAAAIRARSKA